MLGEISLGAPRTEVLSAVYRGQLNVHGLGFSPDHHTIAVVSSGSNSVSFIDTGTNVVKGVTYIGRAPHEAFFTPDGKEVWATDRGQDYISVIDAATFKEGVRIAVADGPGMTLFRPDGRVAFVVSSFTPEVDVIDMQTRAVVARIPVTSPFSPNLFISADDREVWMTHKDVGRVTVIDAQTFEVRAVICRRHRGYAGHRPGTSLGRRGRGAVGAPRGCQGGGRLRPGGAAVAAALTRQIGSSPTVIGRRARQ